MLGSNFFRFSIKQHKQIKPALMSAIAKMPNSDGGFEEQKIDGARTDYWYEGEILYRGIFIDSMNEIYNNLLKITGTDTLSSDFWYQQYTGNQYHDWHVHPKCQLSSVYFIDLPDPRDCTDFYDVKNRKVFKPKVEEGDVIVFPSYVPHRSGPLHGETKTIISTNYNFEINDDKEFLKDLKYDYLGNPV